MSLRVGLVSLHTGPRESPGSGDAGGLNVQVSALSAALAQRGHAVEILTRRTSASDPAVEELPHGVLLRSLEAGDPVLRKEELPAVLDRFAAEMAGLPPFDVLHAHYWLSGSAATAVARTTGSALVTSFHTLAAMKNRMLAPGDLPEPQTRVDAERAVARASDIVVAGSAWERDAVAVACDVPSERLRLIPPGVDTALFRPRPSRPEWLERAARERPVVSVLGRVQPLKGQDLAVAAIAALPVDQRPLLVLAGGSSPGRAAFADLLRERGEQAGLDVLLTGALDRDAAAELLAASSVVLIPSHSETFGLVALEAAASGTPAIAGRGSGLVDSVADGRSGMLLDSRDPAKWANAIATILRDDSERLSACARAFALEHTWGAAAESTTDAYHDAIRIGRAGG